MKRVNRVIGVAVGLALVASGCGGDDGNGDGPDTTVQPPKTLLTVQESIEVSEFQAIADADLQAIAATLGPLSVAGKAEDTDGTTVTWAEGSDPSVAAVQHCGSAGCVAVKQTRTASGLTWEDATGSPVAVRTIGKPVMAKTLVSNDITDKTTLALGATAGLGLLEIDKGALPGVDLQTRRFVALNTFGDAFDTDLSQVTDAVARHGGYDEIVEVQYAREADLATVFRDLDGMDAVVWLTQSVQAETKSGGRAYRTAGLTVNRGGFGDATITRDALEEMWVDNVAGGPGLLFLAGSNTYGDGTDGQPDNGSVWFRLTSKPESYAQNRIVIAVEGEADVNRLVAAAETFFDLFFAGGVTLESALGQANEVLAATGATLKTNAQDLTRTWLRSYDSLWAQAPIQPSSTRMTTYFTAIPYCGGSAGSEDFATAWADVTFDGAYFEGTRVVQTQTLNVDTTVRGVVSGFEVGDRIWVEFFGDMDKAQFQDVHGYGEGIVQEVVTKDDGSVEVQFIGPAHTSSYTNDVGQTCELNNPQLSTTTSQPSILLLTP